MKLLLDEKLSDRIIGAIADLMQKTTASQLSRRMQTFISAVCYMVIRLSFVYLRVGSCPTSKIVSVSRSQFDAIALLEASNAESILVIA